MMTVRTPQFQPWFTEITLLSKKAALSETSMPNLQGFGLINLRIQCRPSSSFRCHFLEAYNYVSLINSPEKWLCGFSFIHSEMMDRQALWHAILGSLFNWLVYRCKELEQLSGLLFTLLLSMGFSQEKVSKSWHHLLISPGHHWIRLEYSCSWPCISCLRLKLQLTETFYQKFPASWTFIFMLDNLFKNSWLLLDILLWIICWTFKNFRILFLFELNYAYSLDFSIWFLAHLQTRTFLLINGDINLDLPLMQFLDTDCLINYRRRNN